MKALSFNESDEWKRKKDSQSLNIFLLQVEKNEQIYTRLHASSPFNANGDAKACDGAFTIVVPSRRWLVAKIQG